MNEDSYIKLPAAHVIALAKQKLQWIEQYRERSWVKFTDQYNRTWWRRLLRLRPLTIDEVKCAADEKFMTFSPKFYCWTQSCRCESLIRLANGAYRGTGEVMLSGSDYETLTK